MDDGNGYDPFDDEWDDDDRDGDFDDPFADDLLRQDLTDEELATLQALGILDLNSITKMEGEANMANVRGDRFTTFGEALRYILDTGAAMFANFVYFNNDNLWGIEIVYVQF